MPSTKILLRHTPETLWDLPIEQFLDLPYEELVRIQAKDKTRLYVSPGLHGRYKEAGIRLNTEAGAMTEPYVDVDYEFDPNKFHAQNVEVLKRKDLEQLLPQRFPDKVDGPICWSGATGPVPKEQDYVVRLDEQDLAEIKEALEEYKRLGLDAKQANKSNFRLPNLRAKLEQIRDDVYDGRGFAVLRGLDVDSYSSDDLGIVNFGITSYIAEVRGVQDRHGELIMHVQNRGTDDEEHNATVRKPFHTDTVCDVLVLVTKECAAEGGASCLVSGWTVYNEIAATRPDIIHTLAKNDWPHDTYGRLPAFHRRPLLYWEDGNIIWVYSQRLLTGSMPHSPRTPGIPGLTLRQANAIGYVQYVSGKHAIKTSMEKGDIRFVNNMGIMHCRESFKDSSENKRHLLRLWLHNPEYCWELPRDLRLPWARAFEDTERPVNIEFDPVLDAHGKLTNKAGSCD